MALRAPVGSLGEAHHSQRRGQDASNVGSPEPPHSERRGQNASNGLGELQYSEDPAQDISIAKRVPQTCSNLAHQSLSLVVCTLPNRPTQWLSISG